MKSSSKYHNSLHSLYSGLYSGSGYSAVSHSSKFVYVLISSGDMSNLILLYSLVVSINFTVFIPVHISKRGMNYNNVYFISVDESMATRFLSFGDITVTPLASSLHNITLPQSLPSSDYETTNVILALVIYSAQSAYVFWSSNIVFTVLYSIQLLMTAALHIMSYIGFSALYSELLEESMSEPSAPELQSDYLLDPGLSLFLFLIGNAVLFFSSLCILHFGYGVILHRVENILKCQGYLKRIATSAACSVYAPHFLALVSIVLYIGITTPIMYDYITVYTISSNRIFILHIICSVLYMLFWTILWLFFTVKQDWIFHVNEVVIKRYAVIHNQSRSYSYTCSSGKTTPASNLRLSPQQTGNNTGAPHNNNNNSSRNSDHKVQFQSATKIFIETEHESDMDEVQPADGYYNNSHSSPRLPNDTNYTPRSNTSVVSSSYVIDLSQYSPTSSNDPDWMDRSTSTAV